MTKKVYKVCGNDRLTSCKEVRIEVLWQQQISY